MISISETKINHMEQGLGNSGVRQNTFSFFKNAVTIAEVHV